MIYLFTLILILKNRFAVASGSEVTYGFLQNYGCLCKYTAFRTHPVLDIKLAGHQPLQITRIYKLQLVALLSNDGFPAVNRSQY
jgi:hypothetical protein